MTTYTDAEEFLRSKGGFRVFQLICRIVAKVPWGIFGGKSHSALLH